MRCVDHCNNTGAPFRAEYRLVRAAPRSSSGSKTSLVVRDDQGEALFTQELSLDVTREAELHLLAEQSVARVLAEATSVDGAIPRVIDAA